MLSFDFICVRNVHSVEGHFKQKPEINNLFFWLLVSYPFQNLKSLGILHFLLYRYMNNFSGVNSFYIQGTYKNEQEILENWMYSSWDNLHELMDIFQYPKIIHILYIYLQTNTCIILGVVLYFENKLHCTISIILSNNYYLKSRNR